MAKLQRLLNESTIIDIKMVFRLCIRYKPMAILGIITFILSSAIFIFSRPLIYSISAPIKVIPKQSYGKDVTGLMPRSEDYLPTLEELKLDVHRRSFITRLAAAIISDNSFQVKSFLNNEKGFSFKNWMNCKDVKSCKVSLLANVLDENIQVENGLTNDRFMLVVSSSDKTVPPLILKYLVEELERERISNGQYTLKKELLSVEGLLKESQSLTKLKLGENTLEEQSILINKISDLKEKIRLLQQNISNESVLLSSLSAKLKENKKNLQYRSTTLDKPEAVAARIKFQEMKGNLLQLKSIPEHSLTNSDNLVIEQLEQQLKDLSIQYRSIASLQTVEQKESFNEKQRENQNSIEFDLEVSKNKHAKLFAEYNNTSNELNEAIDSKQALETKVSSLKSDLEFQKELESKQMTLKLNIASYSSDVVFEDYQMIVNVSRSTSMGIIYIWSFLFSVVVYTLLLIVRFVFDDKIYQAEDIHHSIKGVSFVGEVPAFSDKL